MAGPCQATQRRSGRAGTADCKDYFRQGPTLDGAWEPVPVTQQAGQVEVARMLGAHGTRACCKPPGAGNGESVTDGAHIGDARGFKSICQTVMALSG